ncbi:MAG: S1 RNA-binding domain-containing protein [Armatimonadota bacterium]|nr:S1 RNA-binding domain-containing protein [bacterium]
MTIEIGSNVKGTVLKVADYGAIVRLPEGQTGLIHISEVANTYVRDVHDYVREQDEVDVKVLRLNAKGRYELSMKQREAGEQPGVVRQPRHHIERELHVAEPAFAAKSPVTFEDRLSRFMKDSEERQHDLKRHMESKRGRK